MVVNSQGFSNASAIIASDVIPNQILTMPWSVEVLPRVSPLSLKHNLMCLTNPPIKTLATQADLKVQDAMWQNFWILVWFPDFFQIEL